MWKVAVVQPVTEGFGFNITTETNLPLVSFAYKTRADAETAATHAQAAVEKAVVGVQGFGCYHGSRQRAEGGAARCASRLVLALGQLFLHQRPRADFRNGRRNSMST